MVPNIKVGDYVRRVMWDESTPAKRVIQIDGQKMWLEGQPALSLNFYYIDPSDLATNLEEQKRYSWIVMGKTRGGFAKWMTRTTT